MPFDKEGNFHPLRVEDVPDFRTRYDSELGATVREQWFPGTQTWEKVDGPVHSKYNG